MRFTQLEYLFLLVFPFASAVVHEQQRPFFMSGGPSLIKETAATEEGLRLRSIYHRGSYTGPNPGLFPSLLCSTDTTASPRLACRLKHSGTSLASRKPSRLRQQTSLSRMLPTVQPC
ncbi:hypothetical protein BCR43DRAFT_311154 [Syncephalastrum racemosum]|uniref:Secreted protein n=1 Tax=Syncephalastrum racemosum TaxID=13706 RepID=A0A1X2HAL5_SYNRA|nr:hypothetical protein BCR43DRAFT_311154 [Syncephalastrum racemosum]